MTAEEYQAKLHELRPMSEWHEDLGAVLCWNLPVEEPPTVCFNPDEEMGEGYFTHFSPLPDPRRMRATDGAEVEG